MNTTHNTKTKRLLTALGVATAVVTPALLFASAGDAQADTSTCVPSPWTGSPTCGEEEPITCTGVGWGSGICIPTAAIQDTQQPDAPMNSPVANLPPTLSRPLIQPPIQLPDPPLEPQTTMGPYTGPWPPEENKIPNPYCSWAFWPNNLPIEGSGGACPP
jgi:hypothetical protein